MVDVNAADAKYPSVELAYQFVMPSYQLLVSRFEAADNRLSTLLAAIITVTTAVPLFAKNVSPLVDFDSAYFKAGLMLAALAAGFGIVGRISGSITLVNPNVLFDTYLHKSHWTFKKDCIARAGEHWTSNVDAIGLKGTYAVLATMFMFAELIAFGYWLFR